MDSKATRKSRPKHKRKPMPRKRQCPKAKHLAELEEARARIQELEKQVLVLQEVVDSAQSDESSYKDAALMLAFALLEATDGEPGDALNYASGRATSGDPIPAGYVAEPLMYAYSRWRKRRE